MEVSTWTDTWTLCCLHLEMELVFGVCSFDLADFSFFFLFTESTTIAGSCLILTENTIAYGRKREYFVQSYRQEGRDSGLKTRWQLLEGITAIKRKR